jgi:tetratricopeptide (TPR) repeat protein
MVDSTEPATNRFIDQNFLVIWLNSNIDESDDRYHNTLTRLKQIADKTHVFTDVDMCVSFLTDVIHEKVFMVISTNFSSQLVALIHDVAQLYYIYILSGNTVEEEYRLHEFKKVGKVSNSIESICELLKKDIRKCGYDINSISIVSPDKCSTKNLRELPPSFMYSQILTEILFDIGNSQTDMVDLINFWYQQYFDNESQLKTIDEFEKKYRPDLAIRWYSRENFVYSILNQALRTLDVEVIIKMGFFLRDLHQQIKQLYEEQSMHRVQQTVYRGQVIHNDEFKKLRKSQGGLLSFNNFLSTSINPDVSRIYCPIPRQDHTTTPVLFTIEIDPTSTCAPFALLKNESNFSDEQEILFSMHSVFRIGEMIYNKEEDFWKVELTLTSDNDEELTELTKYIRNEIQGGTGWHRLGQLLIQIGSFDKAEEIFQILIQQTSKHDIMTLARLNNQLGFIKHQKGDLQAALKFYYEKLAIDNKYNLSSQSDRAVTYNNIASINMNIGNNEKALEFYRKTLEMEKNCLPPDSPDLAITYNNIGIVYKHMGNYREALELYQKTIECQKSLPSNHPDLARTYNNIAVLHYELGEYPKSLEFHEKTLEIEQKSLAPSHMNLATTYCSMGAVYKKMNQYPKALTFYQNTLKIYQKSLPLDHPNFAVVYSNIGTLHLSNKEYSKALESYDEALKIEEKSFHASPPQLAITYNNIAAVYIEQKNFQRALQFYEKALVITKKYLPSDHKDLGLLYNNIGVVYYYLEEDSRALSFFKDALRIYQYSLSDDHELVKDCKENIDRIQTEVTKSDVKSCQIQ